MKLKCLFDSAAGFGFTPRPVPTIGTEDTSDQPFGVSRRNDREPDRALFARRSIQRVLHRLHRAGGEEAVPARTAHQRRDILKENVAHATPAIHPDARWRQRLAAVLATIRDFAFTRPHMS